MKRGCTAVPPARSPVDSDRPTLEQVREAVEMAWTDATNLSPETPYYAMLCARLKESTELLDRMIEHRQRVNGITTGDGEQK